jgi:hypothetical protein
MSFAWFERREKAREMTRWPLPVEIARHEEERRYRRDLALALIGLALLLLATFVVTPWVDSLMAV